MEAHLRDMRYLHPRAALCRPWEIFVELVDLKNLIVVFKVVGISILTAYSGFCMIFFALSMPGTLAQRLVAYPSAILFFFSLKIAIKHISLDKSRVISGITTLLAAGLLIGAMYLAIHTGLAG